MKVFAVIICIFALSLLALVHNYEIYLLLLFTVLLLFFGLTLSNPVPQSPKMENLTTTTTTIAVTTSNSTVDSTKLEDNTVAHAPWDIMKDTAMLKRGMYVLLAVTLIVVLYFGVKTYRSRNRPTRSYGLLASRGETIELNPLNSDSEDDYTVFESKKLQY